MKRNLLIVTVILLIAACNSKKSAKDTVSTKVDSTTKDTTIINSIDTTKADIKSIGNLFVDMKQDQLLAALGQPLSKSKAEEWGADGLFHQDWKYPTQGLVLNMSSENAKMEASRIFSITVSSPSTLLTNKNTGIGSSYSEILRLYDKMIDRSATDDTIITVGSIYDGMIFNFKDGKVSRIFIGAAAE